VRLNYNYGTKIKNKEMETDRGKIPNIISEVIRAVKIHNYLFDNPH